MTDDPVTAIARATEETAKAAGKGIDAASGLGRFFERIFGSAFEELGGALADHTHFWRMSRLVRLHERYEAACAAIGDGRLTKAVEPKFAFALLEAATLENDDDLQDMFARLLANATTEGTGVEDRKAFVSILAEFTALDARLLSMIYFAPEEAGGAVYTGELPHEVVSVHAPNSMGYPTPVVARALWNLARLGCIQPNGTLNPVLTVYLTDLGRALMEACSLPTSRKGET